MGATVSLRAISLGDVLKGVFGPKFLLFQLVELQLLSRGEAQPAIECLDAFCELCVKFFQVRTLPLPRDVSSVVLGHVTSDVPNGVSQANQAWQRGAGRRPPHHPTDLVNNDQSLVGGSCGLAFRMNTTALGAF